MAPNKPLPKFQCTITELYAVCRICWYSCLENIADFTAFKTFYDAAFVDAALSEIGEAASMPGEQERDEVSESLRIELQQAGETCLSLWRSLRAYIRSSYAPQFVKPKLEAAGEALYKSAYMENWEDLEQMMDDSSDFITANTAELTAGGMPAGFPAAFDAGYAAYSPLFNNFKNAQQDAREGTIARINANNALYDKVQAMNADGQTIYEDDPGKFERFVFTRVLELVRPGNNGIPATSLVVEGKVTNSSTGVVIVNAQVTIGLAGDPNPGVTVTTDANGNYYFEGNGLEAGATLLIHQKVEAPSFVTQEKDISMNVGQRYTENVALTPEV